MVERYDPVIYAFEPHPESFELLQQTVLANPKLQPMPYGLGEADSSLDRAAIERVWKDQKLGQVDLMKTDIGGGGFALLDKMIGTDLVNRVNCFMIQFHEWHPRATVKRRNIREALSKTHRLEWDYPFVWQEWVRI